MATKWCHVLWRVTGYPNAEAVRDPARRETFTTGEAYVKWHARRLLEALGPDGQVWYGPVDDAFRHKLDSSRDEAIKNTAEYIKTQLRARGWRSDLTYRGGRAYLRVGYGTISVHGNWDVWFTGRLPEVAQDVVRHARAIGEMSS